MHNNLTLEKDQLHAIWFQEGRQSEVWFAKQVALNEGKKPFLPFSCSWDKLERVGERW